jgi:hypothetical protein
LNLFKFKCTLTKLIASLRDSRVPNRRMEELNLMAATTPKCGAIKSRTPLGLQFKIAETKIKNAETTPLHVKSRFRTLQAFRNLKSLVF